MGTRWQCPTCGATAAKRAKFCARCGTSIRPAQVAPRNIGDDPAPLPLAGWILLLGLILGPALVAGGIVWSIKAILIVGVVIAALIVTVLVLGMFF